MQRVLGLFEFRSGSALRAKNFPPLKNSKNIFTRIEDLQDRLGNVKFFKEKFFFYDHEKSFRDLL